jgi:hypothetical protein
MTLRCHSCLGLAGLSCLGHRNRTAPTVIVSRTSFARLSPFSCMNVKPNLCRHERRSALHTKSEKSRNAVLNQGDDIVEPSVFRKGLGQLVV